MIEDVREMSLHGSLSGVEANGASHAGGGRDDRALASDVVARGGLDAGFGELLIR